jgi:hypothetical protein
MKPYYISCTYLSILFSSDCAVKEPIAEATNDEVAEKLWKVSVDLVKLDPEEIHPKLKR